MLARTEPHNSTTIGPLRRAFFMPKIYKLASLPGAFLDDAPTSARYARKSHVTPPCFVLRVLPRRGLRGLLFGLGIVWTWNVRTL